MARVVDPDRTEAPRRPPVQPAPPPPRRRRGGGWRGPLLAVLAAVGLLALGLVALDRLLPSFDFPFTSRTVDRSGPALLVAVQDLDEYRAATGHFEQIVDVEDDTRWVPSLLRGERTLFVAVGHVDASVRFSGLAEGAVQVSDDRRRATITLPRARLAEPVVDPRRSYVAVSQRGVIDRVAAVFDDDPNAERELYLRAGRQIGAAAAESDLATRAEANTRTMLEGLLRSLGYTAIDVRFR